MSTALAILILVACGGVWLGLKLAARRMSDPPSEAEQMRRHVNDIDPMGGWRS